MIRLLSFALLFIALQDPSDRPARQRKNKRANEALAAKVKAVLAAREKELSGYVLVVKDGVPLFDGGFGMADREQKRANAASTLYDIGSVTKPFTATLILRLEAMGRLKIADRLDRWFKNVPADKAGITVEQLLSHTGGLARLYDFAGVDSADRDAVVAHLLKIPLTGKPGEQHEYSNANYFLLAAMAEIAGGRSFEDLMREVVFAPAKMGDSGFSRDARLDPKRAAHRYENGQDQGTSIDYGYSWGFRGATGLVTTAADLIKFSDALLTGALLDAKARGKLFRVVKDGYALGWYVMETPAKLCHSGAAAGARCYFARFPAEDIAYAICLNSCAQGSLLEFTLAREIETTLFAK